MRVIAKAYKDEPLDRGIGSESQEVAYVLNLSVLDSDGTYNRGGVGFPKHCLFEFDSALYESLRDAFSKGDRGRLSALWEHAKPAYGPNGEPLERPRPG